MSLARTLAIAAVALCGSIIAAHAVYAASAPIEVTACGQLIPIGKTGFLSADLTCPISAGTPVAVRLERRAKLDLRGFTITGGIAAVACEPVLCDESVCVPTKAGRCEVFGGTITGASFVAVVGSLVKLHDMTIVDVGNFAALAFKRIEVFNSHIENAPSGLESAHIRLDGATLDNAQVWARKAELTSSSVTNGQYFGVQARDTRLTASSVTGNGTNARCGVDVSCADLMAGRRPRLDGTSTCGTSLIFDDRDAFGSWGVCSLD